MKNKLTIVIVTYKSKSVLSDCLKNIKSFKNILILDNSYDLELKEKIKKKFPNVKFYLSKKNLGYPRGNNFLLRKVKTEYALLLNPDTKIIVSQVSTNNNVCPRSGWFTKKNTINNKIKRE